MSSKLNAMRAATPMRDVSCERAEHWSDPHLAPLGHGVDGGVSYAYPLAEFAVPSRRCFTRPSARVSDYFVGFLVGSSLDFFVV